MDIADKSPPRELVLQNKKLANYGSFADTCAQEIHAGVYILHGEGDGRCARRSGERPATEVLEQKIVYIER